MEFVKMVLNEGTELKLKISVAELELKIDQAKNTNIVTIFCEHSFDPRHGVTKIGKEIKLNLKRYLFFYKA